MLLFIRPESPSAGASGLTRLKDKLSAAFPTETLLIAPEDVSTGAFSVRTSLLVTIETLWGEEG